MTKYVISFPGDAMNLSEDDFAAAGRDSRAVVQEAKDAGVLVFAGGINDKAATVRVDADSTVTPGGYPGFTDFDGGYTILDLPSRDEALRWAAKIAAACRCAQEVREFFDGAES